MLFFFFFFNPCSLNSPGFFFFLLSVSAPPQHLPLTPSSASFQLGPPGTPFRSSSCLGTHFLRA